MAATDPADRRYAAFQSKDKLPEFFALDHQLSRGALQIRPCVFVTRQQPGNTFLPVFCGDWQIEDANRIGEDILTEFTEQCQGAGNAVTCWSENGGGDIPL